MTVTDNIGSEGAVCDKDPHAEPVTGSMDRIIQIARESNAVLRENRAIALAIAEHLGVTIEKPGGED